MVATLEGHGGPINTFSFNLNGTLLASGGDDEVVRIWDLHVFRPYQTLADRSRTWGQITWIRFLNVELNPTGELLCFGTGRGYLLLYHRQRKAVSIWTWNMTIFTYWKYQGRLFRSVLSTSLQPWRQRRNLCVWLPLYTRCREQPLWES